jgi:hypothetical protein
MKTITYKIASESFCILQIAKHPKYFNTTLWPLENQMVPGFWLADQILSGGRLDRLTG